jgi:hypothetical protein
VNAIEFTIRGLVSDGVVVAIVSERDVLRALTAAYPGLPD